MITLTLVYAFCGLLAGLLIGVAGIGGVILVPLLVYLAGADIHQSIAAAIFSFFISGVVGTIIYPRRGVIEWPLVRSLVTGAIPGTLAGTFLLVHVNEFALKILIAILTILSAARELLAASTATRATSFEPTAPRLIVIGAVTGALSALSGTGGPLILIPVLIWISAPVVLAIGLAQVIQLPVAIVATAGNTWNGMLDWRMAFAIAAGVAVGSFIGGTVSKHIPAASIKKGVAVLLLASGLLMIFSILN
ncbi:MAG: Uncharacterised protein [SAR116 cluster bacterium MED-G04]|nr:MAG: Uncharacterised protein [SAR116 cluster bacterium MED-G04]